jgi:ABC-type bacteriocin/lantibiotic exporter with double-glycine peptidase domain
MKKLTRIMALSRSHHRRLYLVMIVNLGLTVLMVVPPYLTKIIFDQAYPNQDGTLVYVIVFTIAAFTVGADLVAQLKDYFVSYFNMRLSLGTHFEFYRHISMLGMDFFRRYTVGEIMARAKDALEAVGGAVQVINALFLNAMTLIVFPPILLYISWELALLALLAVPFDALLTYALARYTAGRTRRISEINAEASAMKIEFIAGISAVQALRLEQEMLAKIRRTMVDASKVRLKTVFWQKTVLFSVGALRALGVMAYTWYGWAGVIAGDLSLGTYIAFTAYSGYLIGPIKNLVGVVAKIQVLRVHVDRFLEVYDLEPAVRAPAQPLSGVDLDGDIAFESVSFSYGAGAPMLQNIDLRLERGKTYGIVGASGMGKTSLVQLIPRFYDPTAGRILLAGTDIRRLALDQLRSRVGYMQQDIHMFNGTLAENIAAGCPSIGRAQVEAAAAKADMHAFITQMEHGYDTQVGERGCRLSQGQRQRLALARVLVRRAPIVLLDEATSALDLATEQSVLDAIRAEMGDCTVVLVTHRLSSFRATDEIVVLNQGRVRERGTYGKLMGEDSLLSQMQARSYRQAG